MGSPNNKPPNDSVRIAYEENFFQILSNILKEIANPKGDRHIFSEQFDALEKIKNLNRSSIELIKKFQAENNNEALELLINYSSEMKNLFDLSDFTIGHATFISNLKNNVETHLLDVPYKNYYEELNKHLESDERWKKIYKNEEEEFLEDQFVFFDYQVKENKFIIYDLWLSDKLKLLRRDKDFEQFLPVIHVSIFYEEEVWKNFEIEKQEKPVNHEYTIKLFFLFSRINNRSFTTINKLKSNLNFSLWACNKASYNKSQIKKLEETIYKTYFFDIKDIVQSTVTMSIMDYIQEIEESAQNEKIKNQIADNQLKFIKAHKHTIRNFGYEQKLANLKLALSLKKISKAEEILGKIERLNLLRDITIDFIYLSDEPIERLLLYKVLKKRGFYYSEILHIIDESKSLKTKNLFIDSKVQAAVANILNKQDLIIVFNLLVNLYSNTLNHSNEENNFKIVLEIANDKLFISFITNTLLKREFCNFLLGYSNENSSSGQGLNIIKDSLQKLKKYICIDIQQTEIEKQTTLTLIISPYEMSYY